MQRPVLEQWAIAFPGVLLARSDAYFSVHAREQPARLAGRAGLIRFFQRGLVALLLALLSISLDQ